jgi:glycosyltransferase involved in cell wall biosynthesis
MLSYWVTEESGGPGIAAAGFAAGLARLGAEVVLIARDRPGARWLVDEGTARRDGYRLVKLAEASFPSQLRAMTAAARRLELRARPTVLWVNGIWGVQSLAAFLASGRGEVPYVLRPAGSLGHAALARKALKKSLYYAAVESHVARRARAIHCLSEREVEELPAALRARAFVVPSGVDLPAGTLPPREAGLVGVLARLHPIKNHGQALDAVERLVGQGRDLRLELAGSASAPAFEAALRQRVERSPALAGRVRFLGHVDKARLPEVVGRWQAALLLSEQENFGHAVIAAAACGVPTVVSPGVALGADLARAGAGRVAAPGEAAAALAALLDAGPGPAEASRSFAASFGWDGCARSLLGHLEAAAGRGA